VSPYIDGWDSSDGR